MYTRLGSVLALGWGLIFCDRYTVVLGTHKYEDPQRNRYPKRDLILGGSLSHSHMILWSGFGVPQVPLQSTFKNVPENYAKLKELKEALHGT